MTNEAAALADMGLSVSNVVRIAPTKSPRHRLPFDMRTPNRLTEEALARSERCEDVYNAKDADDLISQPGT